jgi:hypothetical protein
MFYFHVDPVTVFNNVCFFVFLYSVDYPFLCQAKRAWLPQSRYCDIQMSIYYYYYYQVGRCGGRDSYSIFLTGSSMFSYKSEGCRDVFLDQTVGRVSNVTLELCAYMCWEQVNKYAGLQVRFLKQIQCHSSTWLYQDLVTHARALF